LNYPFGAEKFLVWKDTTKFMPIQSGQSARGTLWKTFFLDSHAYIVKLLGYLYIFVINSYKMFYNSIAGDIVQEEGGSRWDFWVAGPAVQKSLQKIFADTFLRSSMLQIELYTCPQLAQKIRRKLCCKSALKRQSHEI
jgi:hypothetical protein